MAGAIGGKADGVYGTFSDAEKNVCRALFGRLVHVSPGDTEGAEFSKDRDMKTGHVFSYMYCRRVRVECTSLSELRTAMDEPRQRTAIVDRVGKSPLGSNSYPFFSFRSKSLFISYGHASEWSRATADIIRRSTGPNGFDVFLDQSSIPSGSLWRQALPRSLSECGFFATALDSRGSEPARDKGDYRQLFRSSTKSF